MELDDLELVENRHQVITTNIFQFSDTCIHLPGKAMKTIYLRRGKWLPPYRYYLQVFANGRTETDESCISVKFDYTFANFFRRGHCIISVIDAYGNQRFTKTFPIYKEPLVCECFTHPSRSQRRSFHMDRYINRERLLSEPDELLPNDVLTLRIDLCLVKLKYKIPEVLENYNKVFKPCFQYDDAGLPTKLLLDSPLAELLLKVSDVFQIMVEIPMVEKRTKAMDIDKEDFRAFWHIGEILMEKLTVFKSVRAIFDTYIVADRYCIPAVTEACTTFLKLCLFDYTVDEYFEITNEYEPEGLKELLISEIDLVKQIDFEEEIEQLNNGAVLRLPVRKCLWRYSRHKKDLPLYFQNVIEPECICYEKEEFDFYN